MFIPILTLFSGLPYNLFHVFLKTLPVYFDKKIMKQLMEHLLIGSLSFAAIVLILIFIAYIKSECSCCRKRPPIEIEEGVEDGPLIDGGNNNGPGVPSAYPSRLISPSVPTLMELEDSPPARIRRNTSTLSIEPEISPEEMRAIQQGLLRNGEQGPASEVKADNQCNIIIGVHTNSIVFSGYCVNLQDKMVEFYTIQTEHLPWHASDQSDHLENEMRNFFFALMLWYEKLADCKRFHIYTGSRASIYDNNRLWRKAAKLLEHFCHCERIVVGNDNHFYVSPRHDPTSFAIKIFPAEDLSAGKYEDFQNFIMQFYDIPLMNFSGTHRILVSVSKDDSTIITEK